MKGIPNDITLEYVQEWVKPRVSEKRFKHITGVVRVAKKLARKLDCDPFLAEMGGWLHDACKELKDKVLVEKARSFNIPFGPVEERSGHLLHGPVAAELARTELGITHEELLRAVAEHTLGNVPMSNLSICLFLADCLEEGRDTDYTAPIWAALNLDGELNFDKAIVTATDLGILHLMETARAIHPRTVEVRNHYLIRLNAQHDGRSSSSQNI